MFATTSTSYLEAIIKPKIEYSTFSIQKRLLSLIMVIAFIFCLLIIRLFVLQVTSAENMQLKAIEQWVRTLPLTAKRGQVVDRNGNILAISYTSYDVYLRAKEIKEPLKVAKYLSEKLSIDFETVYTKAKDVFVSESLIKLNISEDKALEICKKNFDGVYLSENISRFYPYGKLLSQVLGYLTSDSIGQSGIENYYDKVLSGTDGKFLTQSDVRGITLNNSLNYYVEAIDGLNVMLNIDINIQNIVEKTLEKIVNEHKPKGVSAIVLDPRTSQVLAMAIYPSFDLNNVPRDDVSNLMKLTKNTTVTDVYEPGSTFKIFTLAAALTENLTNINERFYCPGYRIIDGQRIKCWKTTGHGSQNLIECVQNSCNCCFMDLALRLGKEKLYDYLIKFGINSVTGVDITGESSGIMIDKNLVQTVDLARIGFGQSVAVTQLQLINSFCSIINGGVLHQPTMLNNYFDKNGKEIFKNLNLIANTNVDESVSKTIRFLLEQSLSKTGELSFVEGYSVAGKTGTAQKYGEDGKISTGKYVSSFFGFLNNQNPEYALLLCVDEPSTGAYYGSVVAKPPAKEIFEGIIEYKNIPPKKEVVVEELEVPNLVGKSLSQALVILEKLGVYYEISGEGEKVVTQFPSPETTIKKTATILISTE